MHLFLIILHVMLSLALIGVILLQPGKDGAQALGGGGGNQMYAPRGQSNLLGQATTAVAGLFMVTSISLAWFSTQGSSSGSDMEESIRKMQEEERGAGLKDVKPEDVGPTEVAPIDAVPSDAIPSDTLPVEDPDAASPTTAPNAAAAPVEAAPVGSPAGAGSEGSGSGATSP